MQAICPERDAQLSSRTLYHDDVLDRYVVT